MNEKNWNLSSNFVSTNYLQQAQQANHQRENLITSLLSQRKLPDEGWDDLTIQAFLNEIAKMDSNNFTENVGLGEREARISSKLVASRNYYLGHGIGRSGEIFAEQPKAAGSSLLYKICHSLVLDAFKVAGLRINSCLVLPLATGMSLTLTFLALKQSRPNAKYVLWSRIDQKTCLKCIIAAGLTPVVIENVLEGDEVRTNLPQFENMIKEKGTESILAIFSTTSCFAPRVPDKIVELSTLCKNHNIPHIINNAYGIQSSKIVHLISESCRLGRVDAFIQSTDKNFMVPVGGAIVASQDKNLIKEISNLYPGRASIAPILDLFITLLSFGSNGYKKLLDDRKELFQYLQFKLEEFAKGHNERILKTSNNPISLGMTLQTISDPSFVGSMLFSRFVSGTRVVDPKSSKTISGFSFASYGSHLDNYPFPYLTVACAIGISKKEIDTFFQRLDKVFTSYQKKKSINLNSNLNSNSTKEEEKEEKK